MDRKILALEATRDLTKTWAHVDMDAFYAAAEELANPSLVWPHSPYPVMLHAKMAVTQAINTCCLMCIPSPFSPACQPKAGGHCQAYNA